MNRLLSTALLAAITLVTATSASSAAANLTIPAESLYAAEPPNDWPVQPCLRCVGPLQTGRSVAVAPTHARRLHRMR